MCFFCIKRCMELQTTLSGYLDTANGKTGRMIFPL